MRAAIPKSSPKWVNWCGSEERESHPLSLLTTATREDIGETCIQAGIYSIQYRGSIVVASLLRSASPRRKQETGTGRFAARAFSLGRRPMRTVPRRQPHTGSERGGRSSRVVVAASVHIPASLLPVRSLTPHGCRPFNPPRFPDTRYVYILHAARTHHLDAHARFTRADRRSTRHPAGSHAPAYLADAGPS